eukprot:m.166966 g.166966  ORF g.166966 m.166966 type:complete len:242 (+) comp38920_c0_seq3:90-815(+)
MSTTEYGEKIERQLAMMSDVVELRIENQANQRRHYDKRYTEGPTFEEGDWVWLYTPEGKKGLSKKLSSPYKGPFVVVQNLGPSNMKIRKVAGGKTKRVHCDRLKKCHHRPLQDGAMAPKEVERPNEGDQRNDDRVNHQEVHLPRKSSLQHLGITGEGLGGIRPTFEEELGMRPTGVLYEANDGDGDEGSEDDDVASDGGRGRGIRVVGPPAYLAEYVWGEDEESNGEPGSEEEDIGDETGA